MDLYIKFCYDAHRNRPPLGRTGKGQGMTMNKPAVLCAFADEASGQVTEQMRALKENSMVSVSYTHLIPAALACRAHSLGSNKSGSKRSKYRW